MAHHRRSGVHRLQLHPVPPPRAGGRGSRDPLFIGDKVAGVVMSVAADAENIGYAVPAIEVVRFLEGRTAGSGPSRLFDEFQDLENDVLRAQFQVPSGVTGVLVRRRHDSVGNPLQEGDIITHATNTPRTVTAVILATGSQRITGNMRSLVHSLR